MKTTFGGNSGYIGYSQSVRSLSAKSEGRYPKTEFKQVYGLSEKKFSILLNRGIIVNTEWHHTSVYGNKTKFYAISDEILFHCINGDMETAFSLYKETRDYSAPIQRNIKSEQFNTSVAFRAGEEVELLLAAGCSYSRTKRGNYSFALKDRKQLQNASVRKIFHKNYESVNAL